MTTNLTKQAVKNIFQLYTIIPYEFYARLTLVPKGSTCSILIERENIKQVRIRTMGDDDDILEEKFIPINELVNQVYEASDLSIDWNGKEQDIHFC